MTNTSTRRTVSTNAASSLIEFLLSGANVWTAFPVLSGPDRASQHVLVAKRNTAVVVVTFPANGLDDEALVSVSGRPHWVEAVVSALSSIQIEED